MNPLRITLFAIAVAGLAGGLLAPYAGLGAYQSWIWGVAAGAVLSVLLFEIVTSLIKGEVGLDLVAGISISAALTPSARIRPSACPRVRSLVAKPGIE